MMRLIRKNVAIVMIVAVFVVAAFIGTIFLVWGRGGPSSLDLDVVAWVGETPIYQKEYSDLYSSLMDFYRNVYEDLSFDEIDRRFDLRKSTLVNLINRRALLMEADRLGVGVSDNELWQSISQNPAFQTDGRFDRQRYLQISQVLNQSIEDFEAGQRNDLIIKKLEAIIKDGIKITEAEILEEYRRRMVKVTLDYLLVGSALFRERVTIDENKLVAFFEDNRQEYSQPEKIEVEYVRFDPLELTGDIEVNEEEIVAYYDDNQSEFSLPEQIRARHILFRLDPGASEEEEAKIKERAQYVLDKAREGADFAQLAMEFSQDGTGPGGGDLGYFSRDRMVPEFSDAAFSLGVGEISDLVRSQFGYHIIKAEDHREEGTMSLEQARGRIILKVKQNIGRQKARELADRFNDALYDKSMEEAAVEAGLEMKRSGPFSVEETVAGLPIGREVKEALFELTVDEISEEIQWGQSRYFFRLVGREAAHDAELEEVRDRIMKDFTDRKAMEMVKEKARDVKATVEGGVSIDEAALAGNYLNNRTEPFSRTEFVRQLSIPGQDLADVFELEKGALAGPIEVRDGYIIARILDKVDIDLDLFEEDKEKIRDELWRRKSDRFFQAWIDGLRDRLQVKVETARFGEVEI